MPLTNSRIDISITLPTKKETLHDGAGLYIFRPDRNLFLYGDGIENTLASAASRLFVVKLPK